MGLELTQRQGLEQRLELKLELRVEVREQLLQLLLSFIPPELKPFLNFDDDDDFELLSESIDFLALHETAHVLESAGRMRYPTLEEVKKYAGPFRLEQVRHESIEVAVDKGAYLSGQIACRYAPEQMMNSHCALLERVMRDTLDHNKFPPIPEFLVRSHAALEHYLNHTQNSDLRDRTSQLQDKISHYFRSRDLLREENELRKSYLQIFDEALIIEKSEGKKKSRGQMYLVTS